MTSKAKAKEVGKIVSGAETPRYTIVKEFSEAEAKGAFAKPIPPGRYKIGTLAVALFARGATNDEAFSAVGLAFPTSKCAGKKSLVTWYRGDAVRAGKLDASFGPVALVDPIPVAKAAPVARKTRTKAKAKAAPKAAPKGA
jgi:hypothetical protein